jgi:hypothetical protein
MRFRSAPAVLCAVLIAAPPPALAWGAQGHRIVNGAAMRALPASVPPFLRTQSAHDEVALLGPEADRVKGAGAPLDDDDDPAHFVDAQDDLTVAGAVKLRALPADRRAYDAALRAARTPTDEWGQGYLPYAIADGWERIVRDFAYWRVDAVGEKSAASLDDRAFFGFDRAVREAVTLRDIGYWGHFVADGSQPLHVSVHFNGWDGARYANPAHYSDSRSIHARFETDLVRAVAGEDFVLARIAAPNPSSAPILTRTGSYLATTAGFVPAVYELEAAGEIDAHGPAASALVLDRLAAGATEMRDLILAAWEDSAGAKVGYPGLAVRDVESGAIVPTRDGVGVGD